MIRQLFLYFLLFLASLIAFLHFIAIEFYFYWSLWWYDIVVHFLGGLFIGLGALWIVFFSGFFSYFQYSKKRALCVALLSIFVVGIAWEVFELWAGVPFTKNYIADTITDIIIDILGALVGYTCVITFLLKNET